MKILGSRNLLASLSALAAALVAVALLIRLRAVPPVVPFSPFDVHVVLNVVGGLFVVALMTERAIEVIISVLRDADAQKIYNQLDTIKAAIVVAKAQVPVPAGALDILMAALSAKNSELEDYKVNTREITYCISFSLGVAMATVGIRGLLGLLAPGPGPLSGWFRLVDILVTGAVIAGGSDGIHQMVKAVLDCFSMVSTTMDKKAAAARNS